MVSMSACFTLLGSNFATPPPSGMVILGIFDAMLSPLPTASCAWATNSSRSKPRSPTPSPNLDLIDASALFADSPDNSVKDVICDYIHITVNSRLIRALGVSANNILGILYNILDLLKNSYSNTRDLIEIIANGGIVYNIEEIDLQMGGGNIYNFIINPKTNRRVNIYSKLGQKILSNYERKLLQ